MVSTDATEAPTPNEAEDQSQVQTGAPERTSAETAEPEYFSENFDPSTLDEALQPAYKQMQGAWTRKTQELAEQRKQAENATALINDLRSEDNRDNALSYLADMLGGPDKLVAALGYEFDDPNQEQPGEPEPFLTRAEWEAYQAQQAERAQQTEQETYVSQVDAHLVSEMERINAELKKAGRPELSERQQRTIVKNALVDTEPGQIPDLQAAYDEFTGVMDEGLQSWASTKTGGATTAGGKAATQVPDLDNMTGDERRAWQAQRLRELNEQTGP